MNALSLSARGTLKDGPAFSELSGEERPPAIVLGWGNSHTLGFVRSLGRHGIPVVSLSARADRPRLFSRYCRMERRFESEKDLLDFLRSIGSQTQRKGVLVTTGDPEVRFLSKNRVCLKEYFHFKLSDPDLLEKLANKRFQIEVAGRVGVPTPRTYLPASLKDIVKISDMVAYPCLIKPATSHLWRAYRRKARLVRWEKAAQAETAEQLIACYEEMAQSGLEFLVQERIEGADTRLFSLYTYLDEDSKALASCVIQKLRQWPPLYGTGSYSMTCRQDDVAALALNFLKQLGYQGLANIEFKLDPKDGKFKMIELNVRCGDRVAIAVDSGVDIPYVAYRHALGEAVPDQTCEVGVKWVNLIPDFAAFAFHSRKLEGLTLREWVHSVFQAKSHAYLSVDDPIPFFLDLARSARKAPAHVYHRLRSE